MASKLADTIEVFVGGMATVDFQPALTQVSHPRRNPQGVARLGHAQSIALSYDPRNVLNVSLDPKPQG